MKDLLLSELANDIEKIQANLDSILFEHSDKSRLEIIVMRIRDSKKTLEEMYKKIQEVK